MGFFSNYFSGKPGQGDFSAGKLPKNRVELFFSVMKDHWAQLIGFNMLYFIIWIPLFIWMLVHFLYLMQSLNGEELAWAEYMAQFRLFFLGAAPLIAITGPGMSTCSCSPTCGTPSGRTGSRRWTCPP